MKTISAYTSLLLLGSILFLTACANEETVLRNDAGQTRYCYMVHNGSLTAIGAVSEYNKCLNDAGTAGFKRVQ